GLAALAALAGLARRRSVRDLAPFDHHQPLVRRSEQRLALGRRLDLGKLAQARDRFFDVAPAAGQVGARLAAPRQLVAEFLGRLERRAAVLGLDRGPVPLDRLVGVARVGPGEAERFGDRPHLAPERRELFLEEADLVALRLLDALPARGAVAAEAQADRDRLEREGERRRR